MKINGMLHKYHGNNWLTSKSKEWHLDFIDPQDRITGKKIGKREIYGIPSVIYSCDQCPHTFYAI